MKVIIANKIFNQIYARWYYLCESKSTFLGALFPVRVLLKPLCTALAVSSPQICFFQVHHGPSASRFWVARLPPAI